eukprot:3440460-Pyramimonas_sp.AAC.3
MYMYDVSESDSSLVIITGRRSFELGFGPRSELRVPATAQLPRSPLRPREGSSVAFSSVRELECLRGQRGRPRAEGKARSPSEKSRAQKRPN